ncbi:MAG: FtsW/RodA/SpoVE family cell cycle protein, partial [Gammaproteobacteria bacterium]
MTAQSESAKFELDQWLLLLICVVLACGLIMLTSASISVAENASGSPLFYLRAQLFAVAVGLAAGALVLKIPTSFYERIGPLLVLGAILL